MSALSPPLTVYYGGTFDPIHNAHLAIAVGVRDALAAQVHLVPAADPPHRPVPGASAAQRAQMVALAIAGVPGLELDTIELRRAQRLQGQPSYTVETLTELRQREGFSRPLAWLIGGDSLASLQQWHRWTELFELAHVIVVARPGNPLPQPLPPALRNCVRGGQWCTDAQQLRIHSQGCLYALPLPLQDGSASAVRQAVAAGLPVAGLVPAAVADYLEQQQLYRVHSG